MENENITISKHFAHARAVLLALLVTLLWSSSWVLVKMGLSAMPPLLFAGIRYFLASLLLAAFTRPSEVRALARMPGRDFWQIAGLGVSLYTFTQGAQFMSLKYFPAVLPATVIYLAPIPIALFAWTLLGEKPRPAQVLGVVICIAGAVFYFKLRASTDLKLTWRLLVPFAGLLSNVAAALFGRSLNRTRTWSPKLITLLSMGLGSSLLLAAGLMLEPWPHFGRRELEIMAWLIVVNTVFAFTWWNESLRTLTSVESSVINNTMTVQIALLAWVFLGESLTISEIFALALVLLGILVVQVRLPRRSRPLSR